MLIALESEFRTALDLFFDRYADGDRLRASEQWYLAPANWRQPERFFAVVVEPEMVETFGVQSLELPTELREAAAAFREGTG